MENQELKIGDTVKITDPEHAWAGHIARFIGMQHYPYVGQHATFALIVEQGRQTIARPGQYTRI